MLDHLPAAAFQQPDNLFDISVVLSGRNIPYAAATASAYMIIEARPEFPSEDGIRSDFIVAGTERIQGGKKFQKVPGMEDRTVRAEIS